MLGSRTKAWAMFTPNGLSVRSRILRISSRTTSSSPDDVSMIPNAPALLTALASCARAIHPIGACTIGMSTPNALVTRFSNSIPRNLRGDEDEHERRDDDGHPRAVEAVPPLLLLTPVVGVIVGRPGDKTVVDGHEQGDRHDDAHREQGGGRDGGAGGRVAPRGGGQPGREDQRRAVPERHDAAE